MFGENLEKSRGSNNIFVSSYLRKCMVLLFLYRFSHS